jgi:hypothetical protein
MGTLLLKIGLLWALSDIIIIATGWYLQATIGLCWPGWWRRVIVDEVPQSEVG